jgi:hypothetical protein
VVVADVPEVLVLFDESGERLTAYFTLHSDQLVLCVEDGTDDQGRRLADGQYPCGERSRTIVLHPRWAADLRGWLNAHASRTDGFTPTWERTPSRGER